MRNKKNNPESAYMHSPEKKQSILSGQDGYVFDKLLIVRLVLVSVLFAVALVAKLSATVSIIILILSAVIAGYDLAIEAVNSAAGGDYLNSQLIVVFSCVVAFAIGFGSEGAALVILFRIGMLLVDYTTARTKRSSVDMIQTGDDDVITHMALLFEDTDTGKTPLYDTLARYLRILTEILAAFALLYAIALPLLTDHSYTVSIHRALTILIISTPISVLSSLSLCNIVGMGYAAANGVLYNNTGAFNNSADIKQAVFDKAGVFSDNGRKVTAVKSSKMPTEVFLKMAAHIMCYSKHPLAPVVKGAYGGVISPEIIQKSADIPGYGSDVLVGNIHMCLGTPDLVRAQGAKVPEEDLKNRQNSLYMALADRYVGYLTVGDSVNPASREIVNGLTDTGIESAVLLTEDGSSESSALAGALGISEFFSECDTERKLLAVEQCRSGMEKGSMLFVYSGDLSCHSAADIDASVGKSAADADILLTNDGLLGMPLAIFASRRSRFLEKENAVGALFVKIILIVLTMIGFCNLWFAVFIDMAAALGAILNSIRVTTPQPITFARKPKK